MPTSEKVLDTSKAKKRAPKLKNIPVVEEPRAVSEDSIVATGMSAYLTRNEDPPRYTENDMIGVLFSGALDNIEKLGGKWMSAVVRGEDPISAAAHFVMDGKRFMLIIQPVDMPDRRDVAESLKK